jgi:flagellar basal body-associated protein FliL
MQATLPGKITLPRKIAALMCALSAGVSVYFVMATWHLVSQTIRQPASLEVSSVTSEKNEKSGKEGEKGAEAKPSVPGGQSIVSIDEMWVNINPGEVGNVRSVGVRLELELFDDQDRAVIDQRQAGIKDVIIETARLQTYDKLKTLSGKLYFKELLVAHINDFLKQAAVREIHFSTFFLQ